MPADHTEVVGARYELTRELARDSSFAVYEAEDQRLSAPAGVAWSVEPVGKGQRGRRSLAQRMARATHPHLISTYDGGVDGARSFVAFHRPPSDLATELALAPFPAGRVAQMGADLSSALETLHRSRIQLGGLHPGHVGVDADGSALLSPWPLAPPPAGWGGEAAWSPPEVVSGAAPSTTGDIWSLGAVLLSALIGTGPGQLSTADTNELVDRLRAAADPALLDAVGTSMDADPARRFASGGDMAAALGQAPGVATGPEAAAASIRWSRPGSLVARRATAFSSAAVVVILSATAAGMSLNSLGGASVALSCAAGHSASATNGTSCAPRSPGAGHDRTIVGGGGQRGTVTTGSAVPPPPTADGTSDPGAPAAATVTSAASFASTPTSPASGTASTSVATPAAPPSSGSNSGDAAASAPVAAATTVAPAPTSPTPSAPSAGSPSAPVAPTPSVTDSSGHDSSSGHNRSSNGQQSAGTSPSSSTSATGTVPGSPPYQSQTSAGSAGYRGTEGSGD
jgi:serine/threonine protein kinase